MSKANVDALLDQHLKFLIGGVRTGIKLVPTIFLAHMDELCYNFPIIAACMA
jgi:hypothetical protein